MVSFSDGVASRTIFGEASGESDDGKLAVAHVIRNRVESERWGTTPASVCMAPAQFSCWNIRDPNRRRMLELADNDVDLARCAAAWLLSLSGEDPTQGAMWYRVIGYPANWVRDKKPCYTVGHHEMYNDID